MPTETPSEWQTDVSDDRRIVVTHSGGHRWFFEFPQGWTYGHIPYFQPPVADHPDQDATQLSGIAPMYALDRARRERWVS